jgi:hypothetical protein
MGFKTIYYNYMTELSGGRPADQDRYAALSPIREVKIPVGEDREELTATIAPFRENVRLQLSNYLDTMTPHLIEPVSLTLDDEMRRMGRVGRVVRLNYPFRSVPQEYVPETKEIRSIDTGKVEPIAEALDYSLSPPFMLMEPGLVTMLEKQLSPLAETDEGLQATHDAFWSSVALFDETATTIETTSGNKRKRAIGELTSALEQVYGKESLPEFVATGDARRFYLPRERRFVTDPQIDRSDKENPKLISGSGKDVSSAEWFNFAVNIVEPLKDSVIPESDQHILKHFK